MSDTGSKPISWIKGILLGSVQLVAVAGIVGGAMWTANYMRENQPERVQVETQIFVPTVTTQTVRLETRQLSITKTGAIEPAAYVPFSPNVSGTIASVAPGLGNGTDFAAGDVLFSIATDDLEIERLRREAELASAQAALDLEEAQAANARRDWESARLGEISDLAARGPQVRTAQADVQIARANLNAALLDLDRAAFAFPFDGRLTDLSLAAGQTVTAGQSYGTAYALDAIEVTLDLSDAEFALLDQVVGAKAQITTTSLGRDVMLTGTVTRITGEVSRTTRLTGVVVSLDSADVTAHRLQPGLFVTVALQGPSLDQIAEVPNVAIYENDQVWLVTADGTLRRSPALEVLWRGQETSYVRGLQDGDQIVNGPLANAREGMPVKVTQEDARATLGSLLPASQTQRKEG